jgi:hypothetical protein
MKGKFNFILKIARREGEDFKEAKRELCPQP